MADSPPYSDFQRDTGAGPGRGATTGAPRWVKVFAIIALVSIVLVGILLLTGGGSHGPGRHTGGQAPPSNVAEPSGAGDHKPPAGGHSP